MAATKPIFHHSEPVPVRFTPSLQHLLGVIALEGIYAPSIQALARCLAERDQGSEMEMQLAVFVRDEMQFWYTQQKKKVGNAELRTSVQANTDMVVKKALSLALIPGENENMQGRGNLPANMSVLELVNGCTDPRKLAQSDVLWMPYL